MTPTAVRTLPSRAALSDSVSAALRARIVDGSYGPGEPVRIDVVARELEVSQTPVREALARLEATGLVVREALRGYRVAPLQSDEQIDDLIQIRLAIEPLAAARTAAVADPAVLEALAETIRQLGEVPTDLGREATAAYWQWDERFHELLAEGSGNDYLLSAYRALGGHVQRFRLMGDSGVTDAVDAAREHAAILEAVVSGDADRAGAAMRAHIEAVRDRSHRERDARS